VNAPRVVDIGAIVARNAVPIFGLVFLHWKAPHLLLLYYLDTILAITCVLVLLYIHGRDMPKIRGLRDIAGAAVGTVILVGLIALVFAWPLIAVDEPMQVLEDREFQGAALGQLLAAGTWLATWNARLRGRDDRERMLKERFQYVTMCWVAVFAAVMLVPWPPVLVAVYAGAGIYFEIKPPKD